MTREEELLRRLDNAKKRYEVKCQELNECSKFSTQQAIKIVNFESRTCENCKYFNIAETYEPTPDVCDILCDRDGFSIAVKPDDYCSRWGAKTVSTDTKDNK